MADISEFRYGNMDQNDRVYLDPVMNSFSGEILVFNISEHPTVEFAIKTKLKGKPPVKYREFSFLKAA